MLNKVKEKFLKRSDDAEIKKMTKIVNKINKLEPAMEGLNDIELSSKTQEFKKRIEEGESLDSLLVEAFAVVRETSKRLLGMRPYDVQLIGGMILHDGRISEMKTGEGKTLMSTLPIYLNALSGKGVHVVTVNDYLAARDRETMGPLYDFLGLTSGVVIANITPEERKQAYQADITYGTNNEFGFDYLRDNMVYKYEDKTQRLHNFAIVDEIDSILIDEARTPLIISGAAEGTTDKYDTAADLVKLLKRSYKTETIKDKKNTVIPDEDYEDYEVDEKSHVVTLTEKGIKSTEKILGIENLYSPESVELTHFITQALRAKELFKRDREYIINEDGEVIIVDENTGRLMDGRRYSDGLHQAIEAKEGLEVAGENQTMATITLQNYFRMYTKLSGMTGTAKTEEEEFKQIYKLKVIAVPTNMPVVRKDLPDVIYKTKRGKYIAIVRKIKELYDNGQPVLVGTASIEHSEELSDQLKKAKITHEVLNAKNHLREAEIIAQAGRFRTITIATNMAGRGTDIKLGGEPDSMAAKIAEKGTEEYQKAYEMYKKESDSNRQKVLDAGGLYILGTERHESRRIDNQLRGRAGRQGDPGVSEFYLSTEDDLIRIFSGDKLKKMMDMLNMPEDEEISHKYVSKAVEKAQKRIESRNFSSRKSLIEYDDQSNDQRRIIYTQRDQILKNEDLDKLMHSMIDDTLENVAEQAGNKNFDYEFFVDNLKALYNYDIPVSYDGLSVSELRNKISEDLTEEYRAKGNMFNNDSFDQIQKYIMLEIFDQKWREHLKNLTELKESVHLRSYGQTDPLVEYKIISFEIYNTMIDAIKRDVSSMIMKLQIGESAEASVLEHQAPDNLVYEHNQDLDEDIDKAVTRKDDPRTLSRKERREALRKQK